MAIDLQNSQNIATGWGPPPKFDAPNISGVLGDILQQRRYQEALQQKQIADAVKAMQEQRQGSAYGAALQSTGVVPGGVNVSGLDSDALSKLATSYQGTIPDTDADNVKKAQAAYYNAKAAEPYATSGAPAGVSYDEHSIGDTWISADGLRMVMTRMGPKLAPVGLQPSDQRTQNENQMLKEQAGLLEQKGMMDSDVAKEKAANEKLNKPNVPYSHSDQYNRTVNRLKQLQQSKVIPSVQPDAAPQPSPAETGDTSDIMKGTDQLGPDAQARIRAAGGADKNLAPGYGVPVDDVRRARARQAMDDPDATPAEKEQARRILAGG